MKKIATIMGLAGFILAYGTAGKSDFGTISFRQMCLQLLISAILMVSASLLSKRGN